MACRCINSTNSCVLQARVSSLATALWSLSLSLSLSRTVAGLSSATSIAPLQFGQHSVPSPRGRSRGSSRRRSLGRDLMRSCCRPIGVTRRNWRGPWRGDDDDDDDDDGDDDKTKRSRGSLNTEAFPPVSSYSRGHFCNASVTCPTTVCLTRAKGARVRAFSRVRAAHGPRRVTWQVY